MTCEKQVKPRSFELPKKRFSNESVYERWCRKNGIVIFSPEEDSFAKFLAFDVGITPYLAQFEEIELFWKRFKNEKRATPVCNADGQDRSDKGWKIF